MSAKPQILGIFRNCKSANFLDCHASPIANPQNLYVWRKFCCVFAILKSTKLNRVPKSQICKSAKSQKWIGFAKRKSANGHICGRSFNLTNVIRKVAMLAVLGQGCLIQFQQRGSITEGGTVCSKKFCSCKLVRFHISYNLHVIL